MEYSKKVGRESIFWHVSSNELHLTAMLIWSAYSANDENIGELVQNAGVNSSIQYKASLPRTFAMNVGLSIELGLKACIIQRFGALEKKHYTHNLKKLAEASGIILGEKELKQLEVLTEFISWAGRYPIGKKESSFDDLMTKLVELGIEEPWDIATPPISWTDYEVLWSKLQYHFNGIGGGGTLADNGDWIPDYKEGKVWKIIKEEEKSSCTSISDYKTNMIVAEAFILAEQLNFERTKSGDIFIESYRTSEM